MTSGARQAAERLGHSAEAKALWWLRLKGYRLVARRFRCPAGEIDLIVRRGRLLAFVEVKARAAEAAAAESIGPRQQQRILRAAEAFLQRRPELAALDQRFDAVFVAPGRRPRHQPDAWRV
ncbi:MAG: YraN family protein [Rhodovibrionaceae bacterium]